MAEMTGCKGILGQRGDAPTSGSILKLGSYPEFELVCRTEISLASRLVTWITRMWSSSYVEMDFSFKLHPVIPSGTSKLAL
ncbi:hypothetical protein MHYP_G00220490 [Metynnis hypsauchen]